jgi:hypothetical protein
MVSEGISTIPSIAGSRVMAADATLATPRTNITANNFFITNLLEFSLFATPESLLNTRIILKAANDKLKIQFKKYT